MPLWLDYDHSLQSHFQYPSVHLINKHRHCHYKIGCRVYAFIGVLPDTFQKIENISFPLSKHVHIHYIKEHLQESTWLYGRVTTSEVIGLLLYKSSAPAVFCIYCTRWYLRWEEVGKCQSVWPFENGSYVHRAYVGGGGIALHCTCTCIYCT